VRGLFDTRVAAQLLGERAFGLAALLDKEFGVKLDKRHQRADWSMRPLTPDMLDYAAQDTIWLLQLRDRFRERLARAAGPRGPRRSSAGSRACSGTPTAPTTPSCG
jgi:ribonuclease D